MIFHSPVYLLLLPVALACFWHIRGKTNHPGLKFSSGKLLEGQKPTIRAAASRSLFYFRLAAVALAIVALARPQKPAAEVKVENEGIDIVIALDSSTSMLAEDFKINGARKSRIDVIKSVVADFIKARANDRIGLVTFGARAYTLCPLTFDYGWLLTGLERVESGMVEDGTAIGSGIAASLNRLKNSTAKSKVIILLTDGRNNTGSMEPLAAAEAAKALKVKVYTIGAGSKGPVPYPARDLFGNKVYQQAQIDLDEDGLRAIAEATDARYYRATDTESLRGIYQEIDRLEKTLVRDKGYRMYEELFPPLLAMGVILLAAEIFLSNTLLRTVP